MEEVLCNLCKSSTTDIVFTKWSMNIVRCRNCGLVYVNPRQFGAELDAYFSGPYLSTIEDQGVLNTGIAYIYNEILGRLETHLYPGRLLDVGCAMGHFMNMARQRGWKTRGAECSGYAARYGREKYKLEIDNCCDLREARLPESQFDACVLVEVIEHLPNPRETLAEVFRVLKPGGIVYVTTPNFSSFRSLVQKENWTPIIPSGHLYYFTSDSLGAMLRGVGFSGVVDLTTSETLESVADVGGSPELRQLAQRSKEEDAKKLTNGRGEGLVLWAAKAVDGARNGASVRGRIHARDLDGRLVTISGKTAEDQKVYLVRSGWKHWVTSGDWLTRNGMRIADTIKVDREDLEVLMVGPPLV